MRFPNLSRPPGRRPRTRFSPSLFYMPHEEIRGRERGRRAPTRLLSDLALRLSHRSAISRISSFSSCGRRHSALCFVQNCIPSVTRGFICSAPRCGAAAARRAALHHLVTEGPSRTCDSGCISPRRRASFSQIRQPVVPVHDRPSDLRRGQTLAQR